MVSLIPGSSSSSTNDLRRYDVFLSFHGNDTRKNFTDHLYSALMKANISTFMDNEEIPTGGVLKPSLDSAIKSSRASVIVLSPHYATSTWCLNELALILEQPNHTVIPIFYHVEPTHVRKQTGTFGDAMAKHKQTMEAETDANKRNDWAQKMDRWILALKTVADLKGEEIKDRRETEFIENFVKDVHRRLRIYSTIPLPQLFGMDDSISSITSWLKDSSSHTKDILTILGISGIGKTSLAKYVYRLHSHEFDTSSFIESIRSRCGPKFIGLLEVQKQLCYEIANPSSVQVHDTTLYTVMIEKALVRKKVFLVLDDIDCIEQLDALLGTKGFHAGSKIIITTQNEQWTKGCALFKTGVKPNHSNHLLIGLHHNDSRQLLCFHAFISKDPKPGYEKVLEQLLKYCEGHPLALTVLGKTLYIYGQDIAYWEDLIETLKKENGSLVTKALKFCFEALPSKNDKSLFKHIACFFVGVDRDWTETILKECNIQTRLGFTNLFDRCLLSIEGNNILTMHQLVQEMGRLIVSEESPNKPWERSRLWNHEESLEVLKQKKGTENILGLTLDTRMLDNEELPFQLEIDALSNTNELMLLQLNYVQMINGSYQKFPEKLRCLCMHGFPLKSIPFDLPMKRLVSLDLSYSYIESFDTCYKNQHQPQKVQKQLVGSCSTDKGLLRSLKILILSFCEKLCRLCGFGKLPALQWLIVTNCSGLREVCESIEKCGELVVIDLSYCKKLGKLPRSLGKLKKVSTLMLQGCNLGEPQMEIMDMDSSVNNIGINRGTSSSAIVRAIPRDFEFFTVLPRSLVTLWLSNNKLTTESFPKDFSCLSVLKNLCLTDNPICSLPQCVRSLPQLEILDMAGCRMLTSVQHPPPKLSFLNLMSVYGMLQKVVFDPDMFPLRFGMVSQQIAFPCDIQGIIKFQPMTDVEEKVLDGLGWTSPEFPYEKCMDTFFGDKKPAESRITMCYEFGIFTTHYTAKEMPNWISHRSEGRSISFTIPSSANNIRGLNFCSVHMFVHSSIPIPCVYVDMPVFKISNETKNLTWIYTCFSKHLHVDGECLILLTHWMFGTNEIEVGDHVTITGPKGIGFTKECGVSLVYDDGKTAEEEEDVLGYYKSWNHIIGGDLTGFQLTTGEYILEFEGFERDGIAFMRSAYLSEFIGDGAIYKEKQVWFRALSRNKSSRVGHTHEEEDSHRTNASLPKFHLSQLEYDHCFQQGPFPELGIGSSNEEDDAEAESDSSSTFSGDVSLRVVSSDVDMNLDEVLVDVPSSPTDVGASTPDINTCLSPSPKNYIQDPVQSSALGGFSIRKSNRKKRLRQTADNVIQELEEPLSEEDDGNLRSRSRPRRRSMDVEQILEFPAYFEKEVCLDKDKAIDAVTEGCPNSSFAGHGPLDLNTFLNTPLEVGSPEGTPVANVDKGKGIDSIIEGCPDSSFAGHGPLDLNMFFKTPLEVGSAEVTPVVNVDKGKSIVATAGTSESHEHHSNDFSTKHALLVEQAQKMALAAHDIVQMHAGYQESQTKLKVMEAEHSVLVNRLSQAEVAWAKAESQLEHSEARRVDANIKILALEESNSELTNKLELLEFEKKQLVERVATLERLESEKKQLVERVAMLEAVDADLEWVLREGLPRCFDKILESKAFLRASKRLRKACTDYGTERGCRLMRDRFQLMVADAELPNYKPDTVAEVKEAYSSFAETDFLAAAGLAELSVDALRTFCSSSDDEST